MSKLKPLTTIIAITVLLSLALPVFAQVYNPGVTEGHYVRYGNFVGIGPGLSPLTIMTG